MQTLKTLTLDLLSMAPSMTLIFLQIIKATLNILLQKLRRLGGNNFELILEQASLTPDQLSGILKINDSGFIVMPTAVDASTTNSFSINLFQALLFAFIGGLILNLMPCVFPVIALKALSFIKISEHAPHQAKWHGWSYTVGVLSSFVAIALVLMG